LRFVVARALREWWSIVASSEGAVGGIAAVCVVLCSVDCLFVKMWCGVMFVDGNNFQVEGQSLRHWSLESYFIKLSTCMFGIEIFDMNYAVIAGYMDIN
jgi:hypothetical protein